MDRDDVREFSWRRLEFAGVSAVALVFGFLFVGETAVHYADTVAPPAQPMTAQAKPAFNAIDYATTGAIKSGEVVVIGPCETKSP